jgi:23S rRNA G2069 N7-methylase RlmK/C1962 C5-methylase RlmI
VDLSNRYLAWARRNLERNGLLPGPHELLRADVTTWMRTAGRERARWDLVVLDPPTFSRSKAMSRDLDTQRDHVELIAHVLDLVVPGGVLWFSTNFRRFRFDEEAVSAAGGDAEEVTHRTVPPDFRVRPHRCWRIVRR